MKEAGTHVPAFHEGAGIRTQDTRLKRAVLYRLSYTLVLLIYYTPRDGACQTEGSLSSRENVRDFWQQSAIAIVTIQNRRGNGWLMRFDCKSYSPLPALGSMLPVSAFCRAAPLTGVPRQRLPAPRSVASPFFG